MQLEQVFRLLAPDDIRIKGHRIGIESVLYGIYYHEQTPNRFFGVSIADFGTIYATIFYYLSDHEKVEMYVKDWLEWGERMRVEQDRNPPPVVVRLRALKAQQQKAQMSA